MTRAILTGRTEGHLASAADARTLGAPVHREVVGPFRDLREQARKEGYELEILSGFRSFERQLSIWNRKAAGDLQVLDTDARPLDIGTLTSRELVFAILRWSALPGASRHHWGTEVDVFDAAARPRGYEVELIPEEVDPGGMFAPLHEWLDRRMAAGAAFGFYRPYDLDRGGVAPERWHLSFGPLAQAFEAALTPEVLREALEPADLRLKEVVLAHMDEIYHRFVINTAQPPGAERRALP